MTRPLYKHNKNWKKTTLEKNPKLDFIIDVTSGSTPNTRIKEYWDGLYLWLTPKEITKNTHSRFILNTDRTLTNKGSLKAGKVLPPMTVMLTKRAPVGEVVINKVPMHSNQGFLNFVCGKKLLPEFLYYWLKLNKAYLKVVANGSTYDELYGYVLFEFEISIPSINEQKNIVNFLRMLDDAIENIYEINNVQENIIQTLFKNFFIDFNGQTEFTETDLGKIPKKWGCVKIQKLIDEKIIEKNQDGNHGESHPKLHDFVPSGIPFVMAKDIENNYLNLENCYFLPKVIADSLRVGFSKSGDVLLTHKATLGRVDIVPEVSGYVMLTPQITYYRILNQEKISNLYLKYYLLSHYFQNQLFGASSQSTREYVSITTQRDFFVLLPPQAVVEEFTNIVKPIFNDIQSNNKLRIHLQQVRDYFLPKIMTGDISI